jgi:cobalt-zinc-cadmium efflux system membrane fusion protein
VKHTLIALAFLLALGACKEPAEPRAVQPPVMEGERVRFPADSPQLAVLKSQAVAEESRETVRLPGRVVWDETRTVRVMAPLGGRITRLLAAPGEQAKIGSPLALIASSELGQAQSEARRADADLDLAQKNLSRARELHEHGVVPLKEVQSSQADHDRAQAEKDRTRARLKVYGASVQDQEFALRSPVAGVVVERNANPGQEVRPDQAQPGSPALFVVSDPAHLWVQVDAPEAVVSALKVGGVLRLRSPLLGEGTAQARIVQVSDFFDPQARTVRVRASVDNRDRRLKSEMYVTAELEVDRGRFIRVPASAVFLRGRTQYAFVEEGDGSYRRQIVQAEEADFGTMRVREGLSAADRVVTEGGPLLLQMFGSAAK